MRRGRNSRSQKQFGEGVVVEYFPALSYGFVRTDEGDVFFNHSCGRRKVVARDCGSLRFYGGVPRKPPRKGDRVVFLMRQDRKGKYAAMWAFVNES